MKHLKDFIKAGAVVILTTFGISHSAFATQTTISTAGNGQKTLNPATNDQLSVTPAGSITIPAATNTPAVLISPVNAGGSINIINNGTLDTSAEVATNNPAITIQSAAFNNNNITINNTNTIKTTPAGPFAIDFSNAQAGTGGSVTINQNGGTITGGIAFPNFANVIPTLNVSGGAITGSVNSAATGQNNGSINVNGDYTIPAGQSIFNIGAVNVTSGTLTTTGAISTAGSMTISGGATHTISGSVNINNNVGGNNLITNNGLLNVTGSVTIDQHNIAAAAIRNLINNNIITVTGGVIGAPIVGNNTLGSTLNMNNFTPTNTIANVGTVNVTGGTVTFGTANPPPGQISTVPIGFSIFTVSPGATANFTAGQAALTVPANATFENKGTLSMNGNAIALGSGATFNVTSDVNSNFTTNGTIGKAAGSTGYTLKSTAGVFTVNHAPTGFNTFAISGSSQVNLGVNLDISNATVTFGGTGALNQFIHSIFSTAGALGGNATFTTTADFTPSGPITFLGANNTINVNHGTFTTNTETYELSGFNNINVGGGTFSLGSNFAIAGATVSLNSGTLALNGHTLSGTAGSALNLNANFTPAVGDIISDITTINVNNHTTTLLTAPTEFTTLNVNAPGILTLGGNFNFPNNGTLVDSGTFNMGGFTMTGAAGSAFTTTTNFATNGAIINVPTINVNGGTFLVQNNNTITGFTDFRIEGPAVLTINAGSNLLGTTITITDSGTLNLAGGTFSAALNGDGNSGSNFNITAGTFSTTFPISGISNIHVQTAGTGFVINNNVQGFTSFITDAGTTTTLNSGISLGFPASAVTINNNGTLLVNGGTVNGPIVGTNTSILNLSRNAGNNNPVLSNIVTGIPTINVLNNATFAATTNISGFNAFNINAGTTTTVEPTASLTGATGATITNNGTLKMNGGALTGNIVGGAASALNVNANYATNGTITGINNIQVQNSNTVFTVNNAVGFNNMTVGASPGSATVALNVGGSLIPANVGNITLNAGGVMNLNGGTINGNVVAGLGEASINVNGNFTLASGNSIGLTNAPISSLVINSPGLLTVDGSLSILNTTINAGGTLSLNTPLILPNGANINDNGVFLTNGNNILANPSSGTTLTLNNDFSTTGNISNVSTIIANSGNFSINVAPTGYGIFTIGNGATVTLDTTLTVPSNATLSNAGRLNMNGNNISMGNASILNISNTFSTNGTIALASDSSGYNISVSNATFSVNNPVSGYSNLSVASGGIVNLNNGGSLLNSINLSGILNINGGAFSGNVTGGGIVNVNNIYTPNGVVSVGIINVTDGGVLTLNTPVSVTSGAFVNPNGTLVLNSNLFGTLTNNGLVIQPAIATNIISGNYIHSGTLQVALSKGANSLLQVGGNVILDGGYIQVTLPHRSTRILNNDAFDVINSNGLMTVNTLPSVSFPTSAVLSFTPNFDGHNLVLIANRTPLSRINKIPTLKGISEELEIIRGSTSESQFDNLLFLLDQQSTAQGVEKILLNLLPDEVNGGLFQSSMLSQNLVLNQIIHRADMLRAGVDQFKRTGYSAGDLSEGQMSYGPIVFGNSAKQQPLGGISGYASNTAGFGFIGDTPISQFMRVGAGLSYANTLVKVGNSGGSTTTIASVQGTLYSSANYGPLFLDGMISYGVNHYKGKRNIQLFGETASANYQSGQYGGRARAGFSIPVYTVEVAPLGYVQYTHLNRSRYQEKGAPNFNLAVESHQVVGTQFGMGFRVTEVSQAEEFLPELHVMFINDVRSPDLIVTSQFANGGGAFVSQGPKPPKAGVNIGMSVTALMQEDFLLVGGYDYETKKGFNSHSASVKFKWLFF